MKILAHLVLLASASIANAQAPSLSVNSRIKLPEGSAEKGSLVASLGQFLSAQDGGLEKNKWVYTPQLLQTAILFEEIKGAAFVGEGDAQLVCRPHLSNLVPLGGDRHFVQLFYIGMEEGVPVLNASVELIAHKAKEGYLFSSPLAMNSKGWKFQRIGNMTFHYRGALNLAKVKEYHGLVAAFDRRLDSAPREVAFYFFEDDMEAQQSMGLPYSLDYNGEGGSAGWNAVLEAQEIYLVSKARFDGFDPHDLWHSRLSKVKPRNEVNHAVDEGIATLYGGCWGLTWDEMFLAFRAKINVSEGTDWLDFREKKVSFPERGHKNPTDFMVNALFVKKIEREKGFAGVWDLLNARGEKAYFEALMRLTGISRQNYNEEVWKLLLAEIEESEA